jgi:hypothetical protein
MPNLGFKSFEKQYLCSHPFNKYVLGAIHVLGIGDVKMRQLFVREFFKLEVLALLKFIIR